MSSASRALAALLGVSAAAGCAPRDPPPDATYRAFVRAVSQRDADRAWALLSADTRAWLEAEAKVAAGAAPGVVAADARAMLLGDAALAARPLATAVVTRSSSDEAVVAAAEEGGEPREVTLVREKGWKVRIPRPGGG